MYDGAMMFITTTAVTLMKMLTVASAVSGALGVGVGWWLRTVPFGRDK